MTDCYLVYVTASSKEEAQNLGRTAVSEHLAACANLLGGIESYYHWEGRFEIGSEYLLFLKTTRLKLAALTERLRELHSYSCPAIVAVPIESGHLGFLDWVRAEVDQREPSA
jgi:periplasmic divalent cation tolerance protein